MAGEVATIQLGKEIIEPIVRAQLHASILAALGGAEQLVGQVVATMMNMQVDSDGKKSSSSYGSSPMITWMAEKAIKEAAHDAIKEWFEQHRPLIKEQIIATMKKNSKGMAEALILGLIESLGTNVKYQFAINFEPVKKH